MDCPKCGARGPDGALDCASCGVVFAKLAGNRERPSPRVPTYAYEEERVADGRIGASEVRVLSIGLAMAVAAYAFPLTRFLLSALVTLFHELGHAVAGWLFGYASLPAFDFVYGGGYTHYGSFRLPIVFAVGGGMVWLAWTFRENRASLAIIGAVFALWLFVVTREWRRELVMAAAGHLGESILAGILFYKALAGVGWKAPAIERPLGAFVAFFVQFHSMAFAWRLTHDSGFLEWYREGKGGALMNDLEVVALDLQIWLGLTPGIEGAAKGLLLFSAVPFVVALVWYFERARWHRVMRALRTAA